MWAVAIDTIRLKLRTLEMILLNLDDKIVQAAALAVKQRRLCECWGEGGWKGGCFSTMESAELPSGSPESRFC